MMYGQIIEWTDFNGKKTCVRVGGFDSYEDAKQEAIKQAIDMGWTPRKWYEFWRYNDIEPEL